MAEKDISEALFVLRQEVERLESDHPEIRAKLESLLEKLEHRLDSEDDGKHLHLLKDFKDAVSSFEVEHPTATGIINELMLTLSNLGI